MIRDYVDKYRDKGYAHSVIISSPEKEVTFLAPEAPKIT